MDTSKSKYKIVVSGASGFLGSHLVNQLAKDERFRVCATSRKNTRCADADRIEHLIIPDISSTTDWSEALIDCDVVIHTASIVHLMDYKESTDITKYRQVNLDGTMNLAKQAAAKGVKRFIFISSIKVNGEQTNNARPFLADDIPYPQDSYSQSKYEAEMALLTLSRELLMEIVIIRPPLIYGPGVKGNFMQMLRWLKKSHFLPFKGIKNKRSFVSVYNLNDLIIQCITHPNAANQIFLASDNSDLSTPELLIKLGRIMNVKLALFSLPMWILSFLALVTGKQNELQRLRSSLQVDITKTCNLLDWQPMLTLEEGLEKTVRSGL